MCHLRYARLWAILAAMLSSSCDLGRAPAVPTNPGVDRSAASGSPIAVAAPATVEWRCLVSAASADCPKFVASAAMTAPVGAAATAPASPNVLTATVVGSQVTLTWSVPTAGDPPTSYVLEAGTARGLSNLVNTELGSTTMFFSATNVPGGTYFVRLRSRNGAGTSAPSNEVEVIVGAVCTTAPGVPALSVEVFSRTFTLTWTAQAGATSYVLEGGSAPGQANLANFDTQSTATRYATLVDPGTYYMRVRSKNACGRSVPSNEVVIFLPPYTVAFRPLLRGLNPAPCGVVAPGGFCAQAVVPRGDFGEFHEIWEPSRPVIRADGNITDTTFTATLQCTNGAASGSINATWDGSKYVGTWTFGGSSGTVRVERGIVDPQCLVP